MKAKTGIISIAVPIIIWIFYGFWMLPVIINAETWFFGVKFNGISAIMIHFSIGISGMIMGWLIYKKKKFAYFGVLCLFFIVSLDVMANRLSCLADPFC